MSVSFLGCVLTFCLTRAFSRINATVMGSKPPAKGKKGGKAAEEEEEEEEEAVDEEE